MSDSITLRVTRYRPDKDREPAYQDYDVPLREEWTVLDTPSPQQDNGSDCGVFLLSTAKAIGLGLEPSVYGPRDIPTLRKKIVAELLNGGLEGEFDPVGNTGESRL